MTIRRDILKGDGANTVFQTTRGYATNTVRIWLIREDSLTPLTEFQELGGGFLMLNSPLALNEEIKVEYTLEGTLPEDNKEEYDIKKRIVQLEEAVKVLHASNIALREAVNNRINVSTFQAWTRLIEKKTGITLVDNNLGYISQELYESKS